MAIKRSGVEKVNGGQKSRKLREGPRLHYMWSIVCREDAELNDLNLDIEKVVEVLTESCEEAIFQIERGEQTKRLHFQGWLKFKKATRGVTLMNKLQARMGGLYKNCSFWSEPSRGGAGRKYAYKTDTRLSGPFVVPKNLYIGQDLPARAELYDWQEDIVKAHEDYNPADLSRKINWIWDEVGDCGKTTLAKYMLFHYPDEVGVFSGKTSDVKYAWRPSMITCFFMYPREVEEHVSYSAMESVKDGICFSGKFESCMKIGCRPLVYVICNFAPDKEKLSEDRWHVTNLTSEERQ